MNKRYRIYAAHGGYKNGIIMFDITNSQPGQLNTFFDCLTSDCSIVVNTDETLQLP